MVSQHVVNLSLFFFALLSGVCFTLALWGGMAIGLGGNFCRHFAVGCGFSASLGLRLGFRFSLGHDDFRRCRRFRLVGFVVGADALVDVVDELTIRIDLEAGFLGLNLSIANRQWTISNWYPSS